jgi:hypothetical protein
MYADAHPLTLCLDIDRVRDMLGQWRRDAAAAGRLARAIAVAAARTHLATGHDVVIPQFLGRVAFIEQLAELAQATGAGFHHVVLMDSKENSLRRFAARGPVDGRPVSATELAEMYDRLLGVIAGRSDTRVVRTSDGQVDRAYRDFLAVL